MIREQFSETIQETMPTDEWLILQDAYREEENLANESLFALSNGYLGIRGVFEEGTRKSLPYFYINGVFDKSETFMRELATQPNPLGLKLYVDKQPLGIETCEIRDFARVLNLKNGTVLRHMVARDPKGRETLIESIRFVSRKHEHRMGIRMLVTPLNYSGIVEVESIIDGSIVNFHDAPRFKVKHTVMTANEMLGQDGCYVETATRDNGLHVGVGTRTFGYVDGKEVLGNRRTGCYGESAVEFGDLHLAQGQTAEIVKYIAIYTERECPAEELLRRTAGEIEQFRITGFAGELAQSAAEYALLWEEADLKIEGDPELDRAVRFNIFHLMSTGNASDSRINIGAKLLTGEEYGGHAFWDNEMFLLPFFAYVFPEMAKRQEEYRYHLLDAARANAAKNGFKGAQYPWESADDGTEQCPDWTIEPDGSCYRCYVAVYEHHVTAAVAYGIRNYARITGDRGFLYGEGAEILIETARFWDSRCEYIAEKDRYEIRRVTGPDEWHEPVNNNLYTNYLARWNLLYVRALLEEMAVKDADAYSAVIEKTGLSVEETEHWKYVADRIYLPRKEGTKLLEEFEGYFELDDVVIEEYDSHDWPVRPAILKTKDVSETQIIKQADVVMLLHLLGEEFDAETQLENYRYYEKRTMHGSSLSPSIYAAMGLKVGDDSKAGRYLRRAAMLDLLNLQKNTREGIHAANTAGVWQTIVFGFAGVETDEHGMLKIRPHMPADWTSLRFRIHSGASRVEISVTPDNAAEVRLLSGLHLTVEINGERREL
ncbi:MAG: glycosyl hydrolase family 65 protein [Lachnospiraceae bacterium]|nr:glycosyl hydrolase family 65 protein [Lachnospiraceae bacterium]